MSWEELCEKAKEMSIFHCFINEYWIEFERRFVFFKDGTIRLGVDIYGGGCIVATDRTYEQMYQIMEALR